MKLNDWILKWHDRQTTTISVAAYTIWILLFLGVFNALICNENPLYIKTHQGMRFPAFNDFFHDITLRKRIPFNIPEGQGLYTLIPYSYDSIDPLNMSAKSPFGPQQVKSRRYKHWLGTDILGRDVASGLCRSLYNSTRVAILATLFSLFIGTFLGLLAGVAGNQRLQMSIPRILLFMVFVFLFIFYLFVFLKYSLWLDLFWMLVALGCTLYIALYMQDIGKTKVSVPVNNIISLLIEVRKSVPGLIWVLVLIGIFRNPGLFSTVLIISLVGWTNFARVARAEAMSMVSGNFIAYADAIGVGIFRIMVKHIYPNIRPIILTMAIFAFTGNILLEATLSFLGMGLPADEVSFGSFFAAAKSNINAWWLIVFPGVVFFLLVFSLRLVSGKTSEQW